MNVATMASPEASAEVDTRPWKVVTHHRPDTDAYACIWGAVRFVVKDDPYELAFVPAGTALPAEEAEGYRVLEMDTGKGALDQHEKELTRSSSFQLFCEKYGLTEDPGILPILELTKATDNVEDVDRTSVHFILKGLAWYYKNKETKEIDWESACIFAFAALDILYGQARERNNNREAYNVHKDVRELPNGLRVVNLWFRPSTRDAAFEAGNDVVIFFNKKADKKFYVSAQCKRNSPVKLDRVVFALRTAEAKKRNVPTKGMDLWAIGSSDPRLGAWFMHDSRKLVSCGTLGHELSETQEFTTLSIGKIVDTICQELSGLKFG